MCVLENGIKNVNVLIHLCILMPVLLCYKVTDMTSNHSQYNKYMEGAKRIWAEKMRNMEKICCFYLKENQSKKDYVPLSRGK